MIHPPPTITIGRRFIRICRLWMARIPGRTAIRRRPRGLGQSARSIRSYLQPSMILRQRCWPGSQYWKSRLADIDRDITAMEGRDARSKLAGVTPALVAKTLEIVQAEPKRPSATVQHTPPASFKPGQKLDIQLTGDKVDIQLGRAFPQ